jgi:transposase
MARLLGHSPSTVSREISRNGGYDRYRAALADEKAALGDKGYDSKLNREAARQRGICPAIPYRSKTKDMPIFFPKAVYKTRARIEQAVGNLERFKRIALRCEKTAQNYGSFVALALGFILIKSVHTA